MQANESPLRKRPIARSRKFQKLQRHRDTCRIQRSLALPAGHMRAEARVLSSGGSTKEVPGILCNSIELGRSELHLPPAADRSMLADWLAASGAGFRFSFKAPQRITHILRLTNSSEAVAALSHALAPVVSAGRMGVALFQLPPNFKADLSRLESFPFARYRFRKSKYS